MGLSKYEDGIRSSLGNFSITPPPQPDTVPYFIRFVRFGNILTGMWGSAGTPWPEAFSHDFGTALDGLQQRIVISGSCFSAQGYADYDYVSLNLGSPCFTCNGFEPPFDQRNR